jgi:hypothetical protein
VHTRAATLWQGLLKLIEMRINAVATQLLQQNKNTISMLRTIVTVTYKDAWMLR